MAKSLLQPLWSYLVHRWGSVISYTLFPAGVGWVVYTGVGIYFALKDLGPWRSESTRIHKDVWPTKKEVFRVGGIQTAIYALLNVLMWYVYPHHVKVPIEAPTVWEFLRDLCISLLVGDFLVYWEHRIHHQLRFLYTNVHYVHHRFKADLFAWAAGWVHPFELIVFAFCMIVYPWLLCPVHPLTLWVYISIFVCLLLEEHSGHDVWWSPYYWVPVVFGGAVPHSVHHTKVTSNFGFIFAIWDKIFGTYLAPSSVHKDVE